MRRAVILAAFLLQLPALVQAQATSLSGRLTDPQGAPVAAAELRLSRQDMGLTRATRTDDTGTYRFEALPAGVFVVEASKTGFKRRVDIVTLAHDPLALDLRLDVAGVDETMVVTANGLTQVASEIAKPLTTIDADEIRARNAATLGDIVRFTPGVQIRTNGGPGQFAQMRLRGLRPDAGAVLIDGLRFRDASTSQGDAGSFFSNLNFVAADRVEVLRGSGSSLYGTNAVGGVVNVVTREGGGPFGAEAQLEGGSLGWMRGRAAVHGSAAHERLAYSVGALQHTVLDGQDGNDRARSTGAQAAVRAELTAKTSLSLRLFGSDDDVRLNTSPTTSGLPAVNIPDATIVDAVPSVTYLPGRDDPDNRRDSTFHASALVFRHQASSSVSLQASAQHVHTTRIFRNGPGGASFQPAAETYGNYVGDVDTLDARTFWRPGAWITVTAGYELERERYFDRQDNNLPAARRVATETRIVQTAHAAFAAAQLAFLERRLHVSLSGRGQTFRLARPRLSATGTPNAYASASLSAPPRAITGDVSVAYLLPASATKLRVHAGNAYRAASLYERFGGGFSNDPVTGQLAFTPYGDPRLEPDRYRAIDAGLDQHLLDSRLLLSATVFYNKVVTLTGFDSSGGVRPDTDPFGRTMGYVNGSGGYSRGLELGAEARPLSALRASASYTFTDAETDRDVTVAGFFAVPNVFRHTATLVVTARPTGRADLTIDLFRGSEHLTAFFAAGRTRAYRFPGFTRAGFVASYRLSRNDIRPRRAYVRVDNVLGSTYYEGGWRALGRTIVGGLSFGY